jgi:amino acid transporter
MGMNRTYSTSSAFVAIAQGARIPHLADAFNVFLVFTALTCANTNLYVASRSLFGLTSRLDGGGRGSGGSRLTHALMDALAWLGRTNSHRVPLRAMIVSAFAFIWVPFLQLKHGGSNETTTIGIEGSPVCRSICRISGL